MKIFYFLTTIMVSFVQANAQNIVELEYFIDTDAGFGQNTQVTITPTADGSFPFTVNLSSIAPGYHILYYRTKDQSGKWGHTAWKNIEVAQNSTPANISSIEYFFGTDPGFGQGTIVPVTSPAQDVSYSFNIPNSVAIPGNKDLFVRVIDSDNITSLTSWKNISIVIGSGVHTLRDNSFTFYPNPSTGSVRLNLKEKPNTPLHADITNQSGIRVKSFSVSDIITDIRMDYPSGYYFITIHNGSEYITEKVVLVNQ